MRFPKNECDLEKLVAEKVIGLTVVEDPANYRGVSVGRPGDMAHDLPHYATDMDAALRVLERMRTKKHRWLINLDENGYHLRRVVLVVHNQEKNEKTYTVDRPLGTARCFHDLPRVICEAALNEVGERQKKAARKKRKA